METKKKFVKLSEAQALFEITDANDMRRLAAQHGCLVKVGPIERVDIATLATIVDSQVDRKVEARTIAQSKTPPLGTQIALVKARLKQFPKRLAGKDVKIAQAKKDLANASDNWERVTAQTALSRLQTERANLIAGEARDKQLLADLLASIGDVDTTP